MTTRLEKYIADRNLVESSDTESEKPVFRGRAFGEEVVEFDKFDRRLADGLRDARDKTGLTHADVAQLLGLHPIVYGRYERTEAKLSVARLIHLSELLDFSPIDLVMAAAPYRYGKTPATADRRRQLIEVVERLPDEAVESLLVLVDTMARLQPKVES